MSRFLLINTSKIASILMFCVSSASFAEKTYQLQVNCEIPSMDSGVVSKEINQSKISAKWSAADKIYRAQESDLASFKAICAAEIDQKGLASMRPSLTVTDPGYIYNSIVPLGSIESKTKYDELQKSFAGITRNPGKTMVVFFHGTGSSFINDVDNKTYQFYVDQENARGELLSYLQKRMLAAGAVEGVDFLPVYGVGSGNFQITSLHDNFTADSAYSDARGKITGGGAAENVRHALMHLKAETKNPANEEFMIQHGREIREIGNVVLIGWSRGAVTAIQFARDMYKDSDLKDISVEIFDIDPVPGLGNISFGSWPGIFRLYPNVKEFFGIYAENERSSGFTPLIPQEVDSNGYNIDDRRKTIIEMPGNHASLVGNIQLSKSGGERHIALEAVARIVRGLAQAFIIDNGGKMAGVQYRFAAPSMASFDIAPLLLQDFDLVGRNLPVFKQLENESYLGITQRVGKKRKYHQVSDYIDQHKLPILSYFSRLAFGRSYSDNISGFRELFNFQGNKLENERLWVNHLHKSLDLVNKKGNLENYPINNFFSADYYLQLKDMEKGL